MRIMETLYPTTYLKPRKKRYFWYSLEGILGPITRRNIRSSSRNQYPVPTVEGFPASKIVVQLEEIEKEK